MCLGFCSLLHLSVFFSLFRVYLAVPLPDPFMVVLMDPWGSVQRLTAASVVFCRRLTSRARRPSSSWCPSPSWGPTRRSRRVWSVNWRRSSLASTLSSLRRLVPLCLGVGQPCHLVPMYYHRQGDGFNCNQFFGDTLSLKGNQTEEALQALVINGISSLHTTPFCSVSRPVCKKSGWKSKLHGCECCHLCSSVCSSEVISMASACGKSVQHITTNPFQLFVGEDQQHGCAPRSLYMKPENTCLKSDRTNKWSPDDILCSLRPACLISSGPL